MNKYREQYEERKAKILAFLNQSIQIFQDWDRTDVAVPLKKLRDNVEKGLFSIVLVGEFSAGKSTFLNALMHRRILPSFTSETTATVNFLCHSSRAPHGEAGIVYYKDPPGKEEVLHNLDLKTIEQVVSTRGDHGEQRVATSIDHVDLFLDSDFLKDGVMLVDSPGLNGVADHHREITQTQVKASHACIFLFSADHPGSKTDFEFLRELKSQSSNIFFVLNKINVIKESEGQTVENVVETLRNTYRKQFPDEKTIPKIWPVAANAALVARDPETTEYQLGEIVTTQERRNELEALSRMSDFEHRLWQYLTEGERAHDQLHGPVETALSSICQERDRLETQIKLLQEQTSAEELKKQRESLEEKIHALQKDRNTATSSLRKRVNTVLQNLQESAGGALEKFRARVEEDLKDLNRPEDMENRAKTTPRVMSQKYQSLAIKLDEDLRTELLNVVGEEYQEYLDELENQFFESSERNIFHFSSKENLIFDLSIGVDLERFDTECAQLRERIASLEDQCEKNKEDIIRAKNLERAIQEKKEILKSLHESKQYYKSTFVVPNTTYYTQEVNEEYYRGGILGVIGNLLFGPKTRTVSQRNADNTARDEAMKQRDNYLADLDQETQEAKRELEKARDRQPEENSELLQAREQRAERKRDLLEKELLEKEKAFQQSTKEKAARTCSRLRNEILDTLENERDVVLQEIRKYLQTQKADYIRTVQDIVNVGLNQELERTQRQLDELIHVIESEGEKRDQALIQAQEDRERTLKLLDIGAELCALLDTAMDDHIEQEDLA